MSSCGTRKTDHKLTIAHVQKLTPDFSRKAYLETMKLDSSVAFNAGEPKFLTELNNRLTSTPLDDWKVYLTWHELRTASPSLSSPFVRGS